MKRARGLVCLILLFCCFYAGADENDGEIPIWLLLEKAQTEMNREEFGSALQLYREIIEREGSIPEAELGLARIFKEEGDFRLAEMQYKKALDLSHNLYILQQKYILIYELASIYRLEKKYKDYEETLLLVIRDDDLYSAPEYMDFRDSMVDMLKKQGLNKLVSLYRLEIDFSLPAHVFLGTLYCRSGRYNQAIHHLVYSSLSVISRIIDELKLYDPDYEFDSVQRVLAAALQDRELDTYIRNSDLYQSLYYLASSLFAEGNLTEAKYMWALLYALDSGGDWAYRSERQLADPHIEPLIVLE